MPHRVERNVKEYGFYRVLAESLSGVLAGNPSCIGGDNDSTVSREAQFMLSIFLTLQSNISLQSTRMCFFGKNLSSSLVLNGPSLLTFHGTGLSHFRFRHLPNASLTCQRLQETAYKTHLRLASWGPNLHLTLHLPPFTPCEKQSASGSSFSSVQSEPQVVKVTNPRKMHRFKGTFQNHCFTLEPDLLCFWGSVHLGRLRPSNSIPAGLIFQL